MRAMGKKLEQAPDVGLNRAGKRCGGGAGRSRWHRAQRGNRPWRQWQAQVASGATAVPPQQCCPRLGKPTSGPAQYAQCDFNLFKISKLV
jgi:hypothetical protein